MNHPSITKHIHPFSPDPSSLAHLGFGTYPLQSVIETALQQSRRADWSVTGLTRSYYLDVIERIVRTAHGWQDDRGAILDPVEKQEHGQTSPRYAAAGAVLLAFGCAPELADSVFLAMDWSCRCLASGHAASPDFWMRELATAYLCLREVAPPARVARWANDLRSVEPERTYTQVRPDGTNLESLHNWTVYAAAGESLRARAGLAPDAPNILWGDAFFDKYLPAQRSHFTEYGMYRDPHDPITYDITTRLQIAAALALGYQGPLRGDLGELLRRGGFTQLLFLSAEGFVPFGGRSSQYHFQEAIISALCELEARRYKEEHPALAGTFKRQAHLSARAVARWLQMEPLRHIKNGFVFTDSFGIDPYGTYTVYTLTAATFFGLAALFADDKIPEAPCPAEVGGYVVRLTPAFHKVFCTAGDTQIEIDTRAHFAHDATGLGRFCRAGIMLELGLAMPITAQPAYRLPEEYLAKQNLATGPEWRSGDTWQRLANLSEGLVTSLQTTAETPDQVSFTLIYTHEDSRTVIEESYRLEEGCVRYGAAVTIDGKPAEAIRLLVPILVTDGNDTSAFHQESGSVSVTYRQATFTIAIESPVTATLDDAQVGNRNGLYRSLSWERPGNCIAATLTLETSKSPM